MTRKSLLMAGLILTLMVVSTISVSAAPAPAEADLMSATTIQTAVPAKLADCATSRLDAARRYGGDWREWKALPWRNFGRIVGWAYLATEVTRSDGTKVRVERHIRAPLTGDLQIGDGHYKWSTKTKTVRIWISGGTIRCLGNRPSMSWIPTNSVEAASLMGGTSNMWTHIKGTNSTGWILAVPSGSAPVQLKAIRPDAHYDFAVVVNGQPGPGCRNGDNPPAPLTGAAAWMLGTGCKMQTP